MFLASSCPSSGEWYKTDNAYGVQHWPCCSRLVEKKWFGVHLLGGLVSLKPIQQEHTEPPLLHESTAARPVLYTIGVVGFVPFS
jgi:hypothetical protein